jgi:hypothetical protein
LRRGDSTVGRHSAYNVYVLLRKLPALAVILCLLAGQALAGGTDRSACCKVRPCCPAMAQTHRGIGAMGASCSLHRSDSPGCSLGAAGEGLAILHVHPELQPRPAVFPQAGRVSRSSLAALLPEGAFRLPVSPGTSPELRPPRFLPVV